MLTYIHICLGRVAESTGIRLRKGEVFPENMMLEANLQVHVNQVEDICVSASKEELYRSEQSEFDQLGDERHVAKRSISENHPQVHTYTMHVHMMLRQFSFIDTMTG